MKKTFIVFTGLLLASCANEKIFSTKEVIQDFSNMPTDSIISKYGAPQGSKWNVNGIYISKINFEDMNNTTFEEISLVPQLLDEETGFKGVVTQGGLNIYSVKMEGKSEAVYNSKRKSLRVSLQQ